MQGGLSIIDSRSDLSSRCMRVIRVRFSFGIRSLGKFRSDDQAMVLYYI